jgi:hypothetical protein
MRRDDINALMSAGTIAERAGRTNEARACAEALIQALRAARSQRSCDDGSVRVADNEAISWSMDILQGTAPMTKN